MRIEIETNLKEETKELLTSHPEWAPLVLSCVQLSRENADGVLAGSAVRNRAQMPFWSLVPLRSFGILEKAGPAYKRGHVGIYRMRDVQVVEDALTELGYDVHAKLPGDFFGLHEKWLHARRN
jgi:hypothetical protein